VRQILKEKLFNIFCDCLIIVALVIFLFPVYWVVVTSLKSRLATFTYPPVWIFKPTLTHYYKALFERPFARYFLNSIIVTGGTVFISLSLASIAAYGFARFRFRGRQTLLFSYLATRMVPAFILVIPFYLIFKELKLLDNHLSLIIAYTAFNLPLAVWLLHGFLAQIPWELEEAAMIDGCTRIGALRKVILPLVGPGFAATAIFCALLAWNDFLYALILTNSLKAQTFPIGISGYITDTEVYWAEMSAVAVMGVTPIIVLVLAVQRYLVAGLSLGAVKE